MLLENPSTYVVFDNSTMNEIEFLSRVVERTGCGLLLDVNNVFVSATNHDYSPIDYIDAFPLAQVGEIHLGGHAPDKHGDGRKLLIDAHDRAVSDEVWDLYTKTLERTGPIPTLIEWDNNIPEWPVLFGQARAADRVLNSSGKGTQRASAG